MAMFMRLKWTWICVILLISSCTSKTTYDVVDREGNSTVLTLFDDSTFVHNVLKESIILEYQGRWYGGKSAGDTLITTAMVVNGNPLSERHTSTYSITDNGELVFITFKVH